MRIKGTCMRCGREFLAQQVVESKGHCPWCGKAFNRDYTANLVLALGQAEAAGNALESALEQIGGMELALEMDEESVLDPIRTPIRTARRHRVRTVR